MLVHLLRGLGGTVREYQVNGVTYLVSTKFENEGGSSLQDKLKYALTSDFVPLQIIDPNDKMASEYAYSAAGKEDSHNAVEEK